MARKNKSLNFEKVRISAKMFFIKAKNRDFMLTRQANFTQQINDYLENLKNALDNLDRKEINSLAELLLNAYRENKQIFVMGNGGSAANASHFACDINKSSKYNKSKNFKVISLNENVPILMAYANDYGYEQVFVEQLKNLLQEGDIVIAFSGSGNSPNIINAIEYANLKNCTTVGITGYDGGILKKISTLSVNADVDDMQISEDIHLILNHIMMKIMGDAL